MRYVPKRDIPNIAREMRTLSPSAIANRILAKRNTERKPQSITMWFKDHEDIHDQLAQELKDGAPTEKQAVDQGLFQNGTFLEVPSVKEWKLWMGMRRRKGKPLFPQYVTTQIAILRKVCREYEKHPDRLTTRDAMEIFADLEAKGHDTYHFRRALKDFLKSKGSADWEKIGVGKGQGFGKFKDLTIEDSKAEVMLEYVESRNFKVYVADRLMYFRGLRINAVEKARIENFKRDIEWDYLTVTEKFREVKTFKLTKEVGNLIQQLIGDRKAGLIFEGMTDMDVAEVNLEATKKFVPELIEKYGRIPPDHMWRHFCAQKLKRITKGNIPACAALMQTTQQSFTESYGGATESEMQGWENKFLPKM